MLDPAPSLAGESRSIPLVVDLDGTLVRSDLLIETLFAELGQRPGSAAELILTLLSTGRAALKHRLAAGRDFDAGGLPYDDAVLDQIKAARGQGRRVYLASASNERLVADVARHLGMFDGWFASNAAVNLKGAAKAERLVAAFGARGFDYIGNSVADLPVWTNARKAVTVGAPASLRRRLEAQTDNVEHLAKPAAPLGTWLRLLRVHQWVKNALVFVPTLMAHKFTVLALADAAIAFLAFSLCASGVYVLNDLVDIAVDRAHPTKRERALASGAVTAAAGVVAVPILWIAAFALAALSTPRFVAMLAAYLVTTTLYSFVLKRWVLVDAFTLAGLYTIRVIAGAAAVGVGVSNWLLAFSLFMFLALALIKRYTELATLADRSLPDSGRRNYRIGDLDIIAALAAASGYNAVVVLALYINSDAVAPLYRHPDLLWFICPLVLFWFSRALLLAHRRRMHDDPIVFALHDRISLAIAAAVAVLVLLAI